MRLLPAAVVAPFASSLGDRFRRERFLLAMLVLGAAALGASAAAAFAGNTALVFVFAAVLGVSSTLVRPALQALLPSLARTPQELIASNGATSTVEGAGTLVGPIAAGVLAPQTSVGAVFLCGAAMLLVAAGLLARVRSRQVHASLRANASRSETCRRRVPARSPALRDPGCSSGSPPLRRSSAAA